MFHKNYIKNVLKKNDIIYFQQNIDDADKPLYLIVHSIKTNPEIKKSLKGLEDGLYYIND